MDMLICLFANLPFKKCSHYYNIPACTKYWVSYGMPLSETSLPPSALTMISCIAPTKAELAVVPRRRAAQAHGLATL